MKHLSFLIALLMFCGIAKAQHMTFAGVPLGQHVNTFMQQLRTKGFKDHYLGIGFEGAKGMEGTFAGYNAAVTIYSTPKSKLVDYVSAGFFMFTHGIHDYGAGKKLESMSLGYMESLVSR